MGQLKFKDIIAFADELINDGMTRDEIDNLPVYLGDDDELNGVHCGWYTNLVDADNASDEDNLYVVDLINENRCNIKLEKGKAILIS